MEEFFLGGILAADELHIVDHQNIDRAELFLEGHGITEAKRLDEPVHEFLGRQIDDMPARVLFADMPGNGVHQMCLAKPDAAIEEQRVERDRRGFGRPPGDGEGQLVRLADDEIGEGISRFQPGAQRLARLLCRRLLL